MEVIETKIKDLLIIKPKVFADPRGYFFESYNTDVFKQNGITANFVQDNQSLSNTGVLRGLHFQAPPFDQGKLVRVIIGAVFITDPLFLREGIMLLAAFLSYKFTKKEEY